MRYAFAIFALLAASLALQAFPVQAGCVKAIIAKHYETHQGLCGKIRHHHAMKQPHQCLHHRGQQDCQ